MTSGTSTRSTQQLFLPCLFSLTAFVGAGLLFTVQPLVARLLLPAYGGSATVWSTSSLFFQVLLLGGYVYSHLSTTRVPRRVQPWAHGLVAVVPLLLLPVALPDDAVPGVGDSPVWWLLRTLTLMVGLPFFVLATSGPLLQRWYSWTDGPRADDPYFLFAASNVGSFGGLLAYPFLIEPRLTLDQQTSALTAGFVAFAVLTVSCAAVTARAKPVAPALEAEQVTSPPPSLRRLALWTGYAFVPSCLMLAVTRHLSTDVAPVPLLWIAPLAVYLATFVAAFAVTSRHVPLIVPRLAATVGGVALVLAAVATSLPLGVSVVVHLLVVILGGYASHRLLAADRPAPEHLTRFYLAVAVGGALGGVVNGLLAPLVLDRLLEYPLTLALLPLLALSAVGGSSVRPRSFSQVPQYVWLLLGATLAAGLALEAGFPDQRRAIFGLSLAAALGIICFAAIRLAPVLTAGLVVLVVGATFVGEGETLLRDRTFYGTYRVQADGEVVRFSHGTTLHGLQRRGEGRTEPTTYFTRSGPLGAVMAEADPTTTAVIGLGAGTIAAYGEPGDRMTFLEIDQAVVDVASDTDYFTFLSDSAAEVDVRVGDGRLLAAELPRGEHDLMVIDAFSSDAIPVHLLTGEAFDIYAPLLREGGAIAVHVSNRYLDLVPVVAAAAQRLGWRGAVGLGEASEFARASQWVVISPDDDLVARLSDRDGWSGLDLREVEAWTDDYASVLSVLR